MTHELFETIDGGGADVTSLLRKARTEFDNLFRCKLRDVWEDYACEQAATVEDCLGIARSWANDAGGGLATSIRNHHVDRLRELGKTIARLERCALLIQRTQQVLA